MTIGWLATVTSLISCSRTVTDEESDKKRTRIRTYGELIRIRRISNGIRTRDEDNRRSCSTCLRWIRTPDDLRRIVCAVRWQLSAGCLRASRHQLPPEAAGCAAIAGVAAIAGELPTTSTTRGGGSKVNGR